MRLLLSLPLGLLIGFALGSLGGGGSILTVPALVYGMGLGAKSAVTTSLIVVGLTSLGGAIGHWRAGRVRVAAGFWFGIAGIVGSLVGSRLNRAVDPHVLLIAFSGLMLLAAWRMWHSTRSTAPSAAARTGERSRLKVVVSVLVAGTVVGFMTGFFGVGGGFIIVPALVLALRFDMPVAVGTSLLVIAVNSATALASRLATTGVDWKVAIPFTVAGLAGAFLGNRVAGRARSGALVKWFVVLLVGLAAYTLLRSIPGL
ncbi:MAG TPA: sulfite exporter TauE/SafE family protein [Acidimicrobiales bacterium]|nr:sulfite exporter TauE/SafE family protein [Acidimicrobiales bacterium]